MRSETRYSKRRRISVACENCRSRKVRCDGARPTCNRCINRSEDCKYTISLAPWDRTRQDYVQELERKVQVLTENAQSGDRADPGSVRENSRPSHSETSPTSHRSQSTQGLRTQYSSEDWQGNAETDYHDAVHIGSSSSATFINDLRTSFQGHAQAKPHASALLELGRHKITLSSSHSDYLLPPRSVADRLLERYCRDNFPVFPVLDLFDLRRNYEGLYAAQDEDTSNSMMVHCMVNLVFAIGAQSWNSPDFQPMEYFERARRLMQFDFIDGHSVQVVQVLVLCAQYLQSIDQPRKCWTTVGFAVRTAQAIGLHRTSTTAGLVASEKLLAVRIWHCCVALDVTTSMSLGRYPTIDPSSTTAVELPPSREHPYDLFYYSAQLFNILRRILVEVYQGEGRKSSLMASEKVMKDVIELENDLVRWRASLPPHLGYSSIVHSPNGHVSCNTAHFLQQRFLQVKMILYRPSLSAIVSGTQDITSSVESAILSSSAKNCVEAAQEMVDLAELEAGSDPNNSIMIVPWWFNTFYCYTAGTSLLAARMSPFLCDQIGEAELQDTLNRCSHVFIRYSARCPSAARCLTALSSMANHAGYSISTGDIQAISTPILQQDWTQLPLDMVQTEDWADFPWIAPFPFQLSDDDLRNQNPVMGNSDFGL